MSFEESIENTGCFLAADVPPDEPHRLRALQSYGILDSAAEQAFDELAQMASLLCDMPIALVSLIDQDRQWFKSRIGVEEKETPRSISFCSHAILSPDDVMIVPDARQDPRFADNPLVTGPSQIVFYAGAPIVTPTGMALGSLCVADTRPRKLSLRQVELLRGLAKQAMSQLELRRSLANLETVIESQTRYVSELETNQDRLERSQRQLAHESATDALTGLGNRRAFQSRLTQELERVAKGQTTLGLMLIDVDFFKRYNDSFGHPAGDSVLRQLGDILLRNSRGYDFPARLGGEEFAVILPGTTLESAFVVAERLRRSVQNETWPNRPITVSVGVALAGPNDDSAALLDRSDRALYASKEKGRNCVTIGDATQPARAVADEA